MNKLKNTIEKIVKEYLNENSSHNRYYRAVSDFKGNELIFEPKGYYESFDDEGKPQFHTDDIFLRSNTPELAASKTVGGAVLGMWSMSRFNKEKNKVAYVYEITEKPQKDLSNVGVDDFFWLKEVRYLKPVRGIYVGKFLYDDKFNSGAINFYDRFSDDYQEVEGIDIDQWEEFESYILSINKNDLI